MNFVPGNHYVTPGLMTEIKKQNEFNYILHSSITEILSVIKSDIFVVSNIKVDYHILDKQKDALTRLKQIMLNYCYGKNGIVTDDIELIEVLPKCKLYIPNKKLIKDNYGYFTNKCNFEPFKFVDKILAEKKDDDVVIYIDILT